MMHRGSSDPRGVIDRSVAALAIIVGLVLFSGIGIGLLIAWVRTR